MRERVAITGLGVVAPTAIGALAFSAALREGRSGVGPISAFCCEGFDTRIAAEIASSRLCVGDFVVPRKMVKHMSRATQFAVVAAALARRHSGLDARDVDSERIGVCIGAGGMGPVDMDMISSQAKAIIEAARLDDTSEFDIPAFARAYGRRVNPIVSLRGLPNLAAAHVAIQQGARGPNSTITTACTSGTQAIAQGMRMIQQGDADVVFAGGTDAMVNPVGVLGFSMLGTLSRANDAPAAASRPFDRDRDGFVIGEGAGIVVLERESMAMARRATILAEAAGCAVTCDAYRITDERPDASGGARAIALALADADASVADVQYINAHGTGTLMNDRVETRAIKVALGIHAFQVPVSSTKSMIGHLLAGAGAVEYVATTLAMMDDFLPPTINYEHLDPECDLDYVPNYARGKRFDVALTNSFGFGGQNACALIRRW
ncbi:MAG: beta-ketoacyl-[acyl-carrier-protein] synthase family protein [Gemmatimonadaceae bacterium]|nr:beta-ketoacyl-[acyl-carrier-protein] synthase family protein [Gemmatimonadaceae bacterium]